MKLCSVSSEWEKVSGFSTSQSSFDRTDLPHQGSESQSTINIIRSKAAQAKLIRTLTELTNLSTFPRLIVASRATLNVIATIGFARDSRATVLITGESGTGKELVCRAIHDLGLRKEGKFIDVNCATLKPELIESQLFGHQRGSFTGATGNSIGFIRAAEGGTLLLDEIGELHLEVQAILLRFLQGGTICPIGASESVKTDVRVIAVTNRDLEGEVRAGRFREDLFERLNAIPIHVPPLRDRREEIPYLVAHFLKHYQKVEDRRGVILSDEAMELLCAYDWPRNVRQLEHEVHRLVLRSYNNEVVGPAYLSPAIRANANPHTIPPAEILEGYIRASRSMPYPERQAEFQRLSVIDALTETNGNKTQAAAMMGISRNSLKRLIERFGIDVKKYRRSQVCK